MRGVSEESILKEAIELFADRHDLREALDSGLMSYEDIAFIMADNNIGDMGVLLMEAKEKPLWLERYQDANREYELEGYA